MMGRISYAESDKLRYSRKTCKTGQRGENSLPHLSEKRNSGAGERVFQQGRGGVPRETVKKRNVYDLLKRGSTGSFLLKGGGSLKGGRSRNKERTYFSLQQMKDLQGRQRRKILKTSAIEDWRGTEKLVRGGQAGAGMRETFGKRMGILILFEKKNTGAKL